MEGASVCSGCVPVTCATNATTAAPSWNETVRLSSPAETRVIPSSETMSFGAGVGVTLGVGVPAALVEVDGSAASGGVCAQPVIKRHIEAISARSERVRMALNILHRLPARANMPRMSANGRCLVSFALCDAGGAPVGSTPETWMPRAQGWSDARPLVALAAAEWGLALVVLRLMSAVKRDAVWHLRYAAEIAPPLPPIELGAAERSDFVDEPLRQTWARAGGPRAQLAWAEHELEHRGTPALGTSEQVRSWNLSSLWRIPHTSGTAWLKAVPPFFAHEGAVIDRLQAFAVPRLIARRGGGPTGGVVMGGEGDAPRLVYKALVK